MIDELAPYPVILTAYIASLLICLYGFVRSAKKTDTFVALFRPAFLWAITCLGIQLVLFGLPHHWSNLSLVGKLLAQLIGPLTVFIISGLAFGAAKKRGYDNPRPMFIGLVAGIVAIGPSMLLTLVSACVLTRDCL